PAFKQYSGEMAAAALLLWAAAIVLETYRWWWLLPVVAITALLGYASVFLWPGILLIAMLRSECRKASLLCVTMLITAAGLFAFFICPNYSPELRAFWSASPESRWSAGFILMLLLAVAIGARAIGRAGAKEHLRVICAVCWIGFGIAAALGW